MQLSDHHILLASEAPAGGAAIGQVVIATFLVGGAFGALAVLVLRHRAGRGTVLARAAAATERLSGLPAWASLPLAVATVSLITALTGMYWDIALHIDQGRDSGPLANPAHYPILLGLMGIFAAGWLAICLPRRGERPGPAPIRIMGDWHAPVGGLLIFLCGGFALLGFPLDDLWHRAFGQDVTLWGPTHLLMLGGAAMTLVGQAVLLTEGLGSRSEAAPAPQGRLSQERVVQLRRIAIAGGLLIGVSIFQAEFDFGVPQFRMVFEPMLLALAAGFALTAARLWIGRGGALGAVAFFLVVRGLISLFVGPGINETTPAVPLYLVEALCIESLALAIGTRRPLRFGLAAGATVGSVGFAAQWAWAELVMPIPWSTDMLAEGLAMAVVAGLAGGTLGALLASGLNSSLPRPAVARGAFAASLLALAGLIGNGLISSTPSGAEAAVTVTETRPAPEREGEIAVSFTPAGAAEGASWANVTSWQGGGLRITPLERDGDRGWRSSEAVPLHGDWKSMLRIQNGRELSAVPIFLPEDEAIPAPEVPAEPSFTRELLADHEVLQREAKTDVAGWLWGGASGAIGLLYVAFLAGLGWGVGRVARHRGGDPGAEAPAAHERPAPPRTRAPRPSVA